MNLSLVRGRPLPNPTRMTEKTSNKPHEFRNRLLLVAAALVLALVLVEVGLRIYDYPPREGDRFLFITRPALRDQQTAFGFYPHTPIREVAVYGNGQDFRVAYDTTFATNDLGLVQKSPFNPQKPAVVVIGDSFTQGEGASPWFYQLEADWRQNDCSPVNLGIMGTGVQQWRDTLAWFSRRGAIQHIFILAISDDWLRKRWCAHENREGRGLVLCADCLGTAGVCKNLSSPGLVFIDQGAATADIIKQARELADASRKPGFRGFWDRLYGRRLLKTWRPSSRDRAGRERLFGQNQAAFDQMVALYGSKNLTVLHLPLKSEVSRGAYNEWGQRAQAWVLSRRVAYLDGLTLCGLTPQDYYGQDNHPRASGYAKILACLRKHGLKEGGGNNN